MHRGVRAESRNARKKTTNPVMAIIELITAKAARFLRRSDKYAVIRVTREMKTEIQKDD